MQYKSVVKNIRISPMKVRHVADLIRGMTVSDSFDVLRCLPHRGARLFEAAIKSARSNADEAGHRASMDLIVAVASVDSGSTLKRMQPHARGIGFAIKKRTSHITVSLRTPSLD
jgi:large subunit ribosomal protein L22